MNEKLMKRICSLIAMNYALPETLIWNVFCRTNSVDAVIDIIRNTNPIRVELELQTHIEKV